MKQEGLIVRSGILRLQAGEDVNMQGTGGIRKLRWSRQGGGKSGGVRVIYYFRNENMPLYLLTIFGKGEKANLSKAERNELAKLVQILVQWWSANRERSI